MSEHLKGLRTIENITIVATKKSLRFATCKPQFVLERGVARHLFGPIKFRLFRHLQKLEKVGQVEISAIPSAILEAFTQETGAIADSPDSAKEKRAIVDRFTHKSEKKLLVEAGEPKAEEKEEASPKKKPSTPPPKSSSSKKNAPKKKPSTPPPAVVVEEVTVPE